jgi:hypothetical protein
MVKESLAPININRQTWLYAERKGLCVVRQLRNPTDDLVQSDLFYIPWAKVEKALKQRPPPSKPQS